MDQLKYSQPSVDESDIAAVVKVLRSGWLTQGPEVERLEGALCEYTGAKHAVVLSSGTAALHLAAMAVFDIPGPVKVPAMSFAATANAILLADADQTVEFVDVDPETANAFQGTADVVVHFAGRPAVPGPGRWQIEDGAHALGASCACGCSKVGSCAHSEVTCFSFHAIKSVTCGEGGACTTNSPDIAEHIRQLRNHGRDSSGAMTLLSTNYRLTDFQAALGRSQLERLDEGVEYRTELAALYTDLLRNVEGIRCPEPMFNGAWHLYTARVDPTKRPTIRAALAEQGIQTQYHYSPAIHLHPFWRGKRGDYPWAEAWADSEISLPLHVRMRRADVERVVAALQETLCNVVP